MTHVMLVILRQCQPMGCWQICAMFGMVRFPKEIRVHFLYHFYPHEWDTVNFTVAYHKPRFPFLYEEIQH